VDTLLRRTGNVNGKSRAIAFMVFLRRRLRNSMSILPDTLSPRSYIAATDRRLSG